MRVFTKPDGPYPKCSACAAQFRVSIGYLRVTLFLCAACGWLIAYVAGVGLYALIAWIPLSFICAMFVPNIAKIIVPPKLEDAESNSRRTTLRRNFELFISIWYGCAFILLVTAATLAAMESKDAFFGQLSVPLGWFSRIFIMTSETSMPIKIAVFLANSFACALFLFPFGIAFQAAFRRSHVTQLGINQDTRKDDDD